MMTRGMTMKALRIKRYARKFDDSRIMLENG
jgi:hypothetical protein